MKKLSESVWGDIRKRADGKTERQENTFKFNIDKLKEVDLGLYVPFYWADFDLEANGEYFFNWYEVEAMLPQIKKTGWRLPYGPFELKSFIKTILRRPELETEFHPEAYGMIKNSAINTYVSFPTSSEFGESYWVEDDYRTKYPGEKVVSGTERCFYMGNEYFEGNKKMTLLSFNNQERDKKLKIRLVKDK